MAVTTNAHKGQALIYCRVSTRKQEEGTSLESQEHACVSHATEQGYAVGAIIHEVYSGAELWDRQKLTQARADIRAGRYQALVVYDMDRLARDPIHQAIVVEECVRAGAPVLCVIKPLDNSATGRLIQYVEGYAAQMEREKIRERNMRGKHAQLRKGRVQTWGFAPYGYEIDKQRGVRTVNEEEAIIVRRIFHWVGDDGVSLTEAARRLNAEGVPSPGVGKFPRRERDDEGNPTDWSPRWNVSQVRRLIHRPDYKGVTYALTTKAGEKGKRIPRDQEDWIHLPDEVTPALVTPDQWERAQQGVIALRSAKSRNAARPYLLRGRAYCSVCGRIMRSAPDHGRSTYRCSSRETPEGRCGGTPLPAGDAIPKSAQPRDALGRVVKVDAEIRRQYATVPGVETWAWGEVVKVLEDPTLIEREIERRRNSPSDGPAPGLESDLETARDMLAKVDAQQKRLIRRYSEATDDSFPWKLVQEEIARLTEQREALGRTVAEIEERIRYQAASAAQLEGLAHYCAVVRERLKDFDFESKRLALEALGVTVHGNGRQWEIRFSFSPTGGRQSVPTI
jgi:DNA invertase Pin-like site-specific DNA recombinase